MRVMSRLGGAVVVAALLFTSVAHAQLDPDAVPSATPTPEVTPPPADGSGATGTVSGGDAACANCETEAAARLLTDLRNVIAAARTNTFGQVANAIAKRMDVEHDQKIRERGCGTLIGTKAYRSENTPRDVYATDCTTYVVDVLRETFAAKGQSAKFNAIMAKARANSPNGLKGTELIKALQSEAGWTAAFWAPDTSTSDAGGEHRYAAHVAKTQGTYYKIPVDRTRSIINYRPENPDKKPDLTQIEKLKKLPFAVLAAKGGMHMSLVLDGKVYEVHWSDGCESMRLIEDTDLEKWGWNSGVIAAPKDEMDKAFGGTR